MPTKSLNGRTLPQREAVPEPATGAGCDSRDLRDQVRNLIDHAIESVYGRLFEPVGNLSGYEKIRHKRLLCDKAENRDGCVDLVLGTAEAPTNTPSEQLENFFFGLGSLFWQMREARGRKPAPHPRPAPAQQFLFRWVEDLNSTLEEILTGFAKIQCTQEGISLAREIRERFIADLLGDDHPFWGIISTDDCFAICPHKSYSKSILSQEMLSEGSPTFTGDQELELRELRDKLLIAERRAAENAATAVEARRNELHSLETIAEIQQEIVRLTRLVCELRAENQGLRGQLVKNELVPEPTIEPVDEAEKYSGGPGIDPLEWLRTHYGHRLAYFAASQDTLFQDQLRKLDPLLFQAIENKLNYERRKGGSGVRLRDIIPTKADRSG